MHICTYRHTYVHTHTHTHTSHTLHTHTHTHTHTHMGHTHTKTVKSTQKVSIQALACTKVGRPHYPLRLVPDVVRNWIYVIINDMTWHCMYTQHICTHTSMSHIWHMPCTCYLRHKFAQDTCTTIMHTCTPTYTQYHKHRTIYTEYICIVHI